MIIEKLKRDKTYILSKMKRTGGKLVALEDMEIHILDGLTKSGLINLANKKEIVGSFAIVVGDKYAVWSAITMYEIKARTSEIREIDGRDYQVFKIRKGETVIESLKTLKTAGLVFSLVNVYMFQGKIPWFFNEGDFSNLMNTAGKYANINIDSTPEVLEILEALMSRHSDNLMELVKNKNLPKAKRAQETVYIPLKNVHYIIKSLGKIVGNYQRDGLASALIAPETDRGIIETIARS